MKDFQVGDRVKIYHKLEFDDIFIDIETTGHITTINPMWSCTRYTVTCDKYDSWHSFDGTDSMVHYNIDNEREDKLEAILKK